MSELSVVISNTCAYIALFVFCLIRYKWKNLSTMLAFFYTISSIASLLLFNFPLYNLTYTADGVITWPAALYLLIVNSLLITAFSNCSIENCRQITNYNYSLILKIQKFLVICFIIYLVFSFPESIRKFYSGRNLADMRDEIYGVNTSSNLFIVSLIGRLFGSMSIFLISTACIKYFIYKKLDKIDIYSIIVYFLLKVTIVFSMVTRQTIIFSMFEIVVIVLMFNSCFSSKIKRKIVMLSFVIIIFLGGIFATISNSRFGGNKQNETLSMLRYTGEAQLNFMTLLWPDLKEPFCGWGQFPLYRRLFGLDYDDGTTREETTVFNSYIQKKFHYYNPTYIFHGVVGGWVMNWGFIITFIIVLWVNIRFRKCFKSSLKLSFIQIILVIVVSSYIGKGMFYSDYQNEAGNFMILYLFILWLYLRKHGYSVNVKELN